jgi:hypothetical protein
VAGLGYKAFTGGAVLTAAQVQGYLQDQSVMKFASATARDAALTPAEGMVCYLADSSSMYAYDGGSWAVVPVQSIYTVSTAYTLATPTTAAQNIYATTGSGATLIANTTYEIEGECRVSMSMGTTACTPSMQLTFTGTGMTSFFRVSSQWNTAGGFVNAGGTAFTGSAGVNTAVVVGSATTSVVNYINVSFKGIIRTSSGGTLTPQIAFSSVTGLTAVQSQQNNYWKATPIGSATMTSVGTWV